MNIYRKNATWTGILFLVSDVASIAALLLFQPILKHAEFIVNGSAHTFPILLGGFLEFVTAISVAGTAITLYPVLKKQNHSLALAYVVLRALEGVMILIGLLCMLAVLSLHKQYVSDDMTSTYSTYLVITKALIAVKDWTFVLGPNIILGINATVLGYLLVKSKIVPRTIALLAYVDAPLIFVSAICVLFGVYKQASPIQALVALPMLIFEVSFAVGLISKGFNRVVIGRGE